VDLRSLELWLTTFSLIGVALVSGCTRETPLPTPTPGSATSQLSPTPSPSPEPTATPIVPEPTYYVVQPGDTAWAIAGQFGVSLEDLVAINRLSDADSLQPGQELIIPEAGGPDAAEEAETESKVEKDSDYESRHTYTVAEGDTLWSIALEHDTSVDQIASLNGLDPEAILSPGQELLVE
jgi:LysM repeat protein